MTGIAITVGTLSQRILSVSSRRIYDRALESFDVLVVVLHFALQYARPGIPLKPNLIENSSFFSTRRIKFFHDRVEIDNIGIGKASQIAT